MTERKAGVPGDGGRALHNKRISCDGPVCRSMFAWKRFAGCFSLMLGHSSLLAEGSSWTAPDATPSRTARCSFPSCGLFSG